MIRLPGAGEHCRVHVELGEGQNVIEPIELQYEVSGITMVVEHGVGVDRRRNREFYPWHMVVCIESLE